MGCVDFLLSRLSVNRFRLLRIGSLACHVFIMGSRSEAVSGKDPFGLTLLLGSVLYFDFFLR